MENKRFKDVLNKINKIKNKKDLFIFKSENKYIIFSNYENIFFFEDKYKNDFKFKDNKVYSFKKLLDNNVLEEVHFSCLNQIKEYAKNVCNCNDFKDLAKLSGEELYKLSRYIGNNEVKYYLNYICIKPKDNIVFSSDGCRLFVINNRIIDNSLECDVNIRLRDLNHCFKKQDIYILYEKEHKNILLDFNDFKYIQCSGYFDYPDIKKIINKTFENNKIKFSLNNLNVKDYNEYKNIVFDYYRNRIYLDNLKNRKEKDLEYNKNELQNISEFFKNNLSSEDLKNLNFKGFNLQFLKEFKNKTFNITTDRMYFKDNDYLFIVLAVIYQ